MQDIGGNLISSDAPAGHPVVCHGIVKHDNRKKKNQPSGFPVWSSWTALPSKLMEKSQTVGKSPTRKT